MGLGSTYLNDNFTSNRNGDRIAINMKILCTSTAFEVVNILLYLHLKFDSWHFTKKWDAHLDNKLTTWSTTLVNSVCG